MLLDRLRGTSLGLLIRLGGLDSKGIRDYIQRHEDVKEAIDLWLKDMKGIMEGEDAR